MTIKELREVCARYPDEWDVLRVVPETGYFLAVPPTSNHARPNAAMELAVRHAASIWMVSPDMLLSRARTNKVVMPRLGLYRALRDYGYTFDAIGSFLGGRDHGTVMYGYRKAQESLETDLEFRTRYETFVREWNGALAKLDEQVNGKNGCTLATAGNNVKAS